MPLRIALKSYGSPSFFCSSRLSRFSCWAAAASYDTAPTVVPTVPTKSSVVPDAVLNAVQNVAQNGTA